MLRELRISGFALMDGLSVLFEPGLNVLTGDTGAGKSTLVGALRFLSGGRGPLPAGERREVVVEGLFFRDAADEEGILLKRVGDQGGRTRAYVNDEMVTLARLRETASGLLAIQSQGEGQDAVEPHRLLRLLDGFLGLEAPRAAYEAAWNRADAADRAFRAAEASGSERSAELAELRRRKDRIDQVAPRPGEAARLDEELALLRRAVEVRTALETVYETLYEGEGSAVERLGGAVRALRGLSGIASGLDGLAARLEEVGTLLDEIARETRELKDRAQADPERLEALEERRHRLRELYREFGPADEDLAGRQAEIEERLALLGGAGGDPAALGRERDRLAAEALERGAELSRARQAGAPRFAAEVLADLGRLGLARSRLKVVLTPRAETSAPFAERAGPDGLERMELLVSFNPGAPVLPLRSVASGGELARLLLALRGRLAAEADVGSVLFDEVDAHVGGRLGSVLGQRLRALACGRQVLNITHLPAVAAYGDLHLKVEKEERGSRTTVRVRPLADEERLEELAEMIRGADRTAVTLEEAREMLAQARRREAGAPRSRRAARR